MLIIALTFISIFLFLWRVTHQAFEGQALTITESYRTEVSETLERWFRGRVITIKNQAAFISQWDSSKLTSPELTKVLARQTAWDDYFYYIILIDSNGKVINSKDGPLPQFDLSDRQYHIEAMAGRSNTTGFFKDRKDGQPIMAIAEPVYVDGKPKYTLAGLIHLGKFKEIVETHSLGDLGHVYLVDGVGTFISSTKFIDAFINSPEIKNTDSFRLNTKAGQDVANKIDGTAHYADFNGDRVFGSYKWFDSLQVGLIVELKEDKVLAPLKKLTGWLPILGLIVFVFGTLLAFTLSRRLTKPIGQLVDVAQNIAQKNYQESLSIETNTELDILAQRFGEMQEAIQFREELLEHQNQKLKIQKAEAVEANKLKSQFLANMSHELRTPLNSIIGFTNRVLKKTENTLPALQKENLNIVKKEAEHLLELINNLLDYSKIEAGKMDVYLAEYNLVDIIQEVQGVIKNLVADKKLSYQENLFDQTNIPIITDRLKVKQLLINLLSNSFKYSQKGTITLSIVRQDPWYLIEVKDEGIGISEEDLKYIFEEFRQVDGSYTRKVGGTGLGLSITKKFVELLGGRITVSSQLGVGSTFSVYLPIDTNLPSVDASTLTIDFVGKIVCIEDDPGVQKMYYQYLTQQGYEVHVLDGSEDVLEKVIEIAPDLIVLDIILPKQDGWEILTTLKSTKSTQDIPIIMASVLNEKNLAYKMKADDYLVKPIRQEELMLAIDRSLQTKNSVEILIVDDDYNHQRLLGQLFDEEGLEYRSAFNGLEAINLIEKQKPHVLLLDLMMPIMDGFDVIETLDSRPEWEDISIIVITAKHLSQKEKEFLTSRVNLVIEKTGIDIDLAFEMIMQKIHTQIKKQTSSNQED